MYELMNKIRDFVNGRCLLCYPVPSISQPAENDCSVLHASPTSVAYTVRKDSECRHGMQLVSVGSSPEKDGSGSLIEDLEADPRSQRTVPVQCSNSQEAPLDEKGAVSTTELKAEPEDKGSFPVHLTIPAENDDYRDEDKKLPVRPTQPKYRQNHQEVSPTTTKRSSRIMSNRLTFEIPQTMVAVRNTTETNVTPGLCERNEEFNSEKSRGSEIQIVDYENHCYEGYLISGYKRAGVGRFEYKHVGEDEDVDVVGNVSIYEGAFACGKMNGKGKLKHARGSIYEGEFKDGAPHGKGECLYPKNQKLGTRFKYEGNWVQDERQGKGKFYQVDDANGEMYSGEWMEDKMQGHGVLRLKGGNKVIGSFKNNEINGKATICQYYWVDGTRYDGDFQDGLRVGWGEIKYCEEGSKYFGQWENNEREGNGTEIDAGGACFKGTFHEDFPWTGTKRYPNGGVVVYKNGKEQAVLKQKARKKRKAN